ncbi:MAG: BatD family protein [Stenotrophobium sp.]
MKNLFLIVTTMLLGSFCGAAMAAVTASLDRNQVANGDTVQLTLEKDSSGGGEPDLGPLKNDFDVLGTSSSSNIQFINGHMSAQRELQITLSPKRNGTLQIPPLSWDGQQSQALTLTVATGATAGGQSGAAVSGPAAHVFLTTTLDQKQPYVQAGVVLTVQLHTDQHLYQASLDMAGSNDMLVQQLGKDQRTSEMRDGHQYDVIERKYLLVPQRSGILSLDGPTLNAQIADGSQDIFGANSPFANAFGGTPFAGMVNSTRPIRLHGDPINLHVLPRPAAAKGRDWLPARQVTLEEAWRPDDASVHAGDPLTLHLRLSAVGQTGAQLPDLSAELSLPDGLKAYPDQAKLDTSLQAGEVVGSREQDIALIADSPGHYQIPELRLSWWDTTQNTQREAVLPARTLDILPATGAANPTAPPPLPEAAPKTRAPSAAAVVTHQVSSPSGPASAETRSPWFWVSLAMGLLWLGTLYTWWLLRRRIAPFTAPSAASVSADPPATVYAARKVFQEACRGNNSHAARRALLEWARAVWPEQPPAGLNGLAQRLDNPGTAALLQKLDRACYAGGDWHGAELAVALTSLAGRVKTSRASPKLAELYP